MTVRTMRARFAAIAAALALAMLSAGVPLTAAGLPHLRGVEELKSWFNSGKGHPRLIFLLSPT